MLTFIVVVVVLIMACNTWQSIEGVETWKPSKEKINVKFNSSSSEVDICLKDCSGLQRALSYLGKGRDISPSRYVRSEGIGRGDEITDWLISPVSGKPARYNPLIHGNDVFFLIRSSSKSINSNSYHLGAMFYEKLIERVLKKAVIQLRVSKKL